MVKQSDFGRAGMRVERKSLKGIIRMEKQSGFGSSGMRAVRKSQRGITKKD